MKSIIKRVLKRLVTRQVSVNSVSEIIDAYKTAGSVPWSIGYHEYKWLLIENAINNIGILHDFKNEQLADGYGKSVDERVVEYPWLLSRLSPGIGKLLDAGSTFNFQQILQNPILNKKDIFIFTYYPEDNNFSKKSISYIYGDLREMAFKHDYFDEVVCHSTLEHIDMDNSMYGYEVAHQQDKQIKSYEYINVIRELERVVKPLGKILLTFPYGKFENHGFFQQFDQEMVQRIGDTVLPTCSITISFAKYELGGWNFASQTDCENALSYNPHTGKGKGDDNAAHSRAICFIEIIKNKQSEF